MSDPSKSTAVPPLLSFLLLATFAVLIQLLSAGSAHAQTPLVLNVGSTEKQMMRYGMDYERLWFWSGSNSNKNKVAQWSVVDCDIDYIRVAMNSGYELTEGTYNLSAYTNKIIPMMTKMQEANPDIKFFASPRPLDEALDGARWQPYPYWVTGDPGDGSSFNFDEVKCAEYLIRYLLLMKSYGFKISFMDLTNEWNYVTATDVRDISALFDDYVANPPADPAQVLVADDIPLLIAPSAWSYAQGASWLNGVTSQLRRDAIDIAASHNTDKTGTAQNFADKVGDKLNPGTEIWNTELHGWKSTSNADEATTSYFMFEAIRAGFTGLNGWLAIGTPNQGHSYILNQNGTVTRNVKYFIFKKLSNTSNYGHALDIDQPNGLKATVALKRDGLVTVWAVNDSSSDVPIQVKLGTFTNPSGQVTDTRWSESIDVEGIAATISTPPGSSSFTATVVANSVHCFEVPLIALLPPNDMAGSTPRDRSVRITLSSGGDDSGLSFSTVGDPENGTLSGTTPNLTYTPNASFVGEDRFEFVYSDGSVNSLASTFSISVNEHELVAHWRLDETSGTTLADSTGNGHDGTLVAGTWFPSGKLGGALDINAGSNHATLPAAAFDTIMPEMTLSMWIFGDTSQPRNDTIFRATNDFGNRLLNIHLPYGDGKVYWDSGDTAGYDRISQLAVSTTYKGAWNHWTFGKDSSGLMFIYVNGQLWHSGANKNRTLPEVTQVILGSDGGSGGYDGKIDDVRLYNFALDASQALALYDAYTNNQAPTASNVAVSLVQGRTTIVTLSGSDPEGADLVFPIVNQPLHGMLSGSGSSVTYTPNAGFSGMDSFTYVASDTFFESTPATVSIAVTPALVLGHWPLDEASGNVLNDVSGNGYHGTLVGGTRTNGLSGGAMNFGAGQRANLPVAPFNSLSKEVTISVWLKGDSTQPSEDVVFYGSSGANSGGTRIINAHVPWNNSRVYWDASDRLTSQVADSSAIMGSWNHWVFTKNADLGEMNIFLNGALWSSATGKNNSMESIASFTLGAQGATRNFGGDVDDFILYNYALSEEQVSSLYDGFADDMEYNAWASAFPSLTNTSFTADPDNDRLPTGVEYVLDSDPTVSDVSAGPSLVTSGTGYSFNYVRKEDDTAFTTKQTVQIGNDLIGWYDLSIDAPEYPDSVTITPLEDRYEQISVMPSAALLSGEGINAGSRLFFRLKVEL